MEVHIYSVKAKSQAGNIWIRYNDNTKRPKPKENQLGILNIHAVCWKIQQTVSGPGGSFAGVMYLYMRIPPKNCYISPPKSCHNFT